LRELLLFLVELFLLELFLLELFLLERFFSFGFGGMSAPERRASLNPIAIACLGFFTFFLPPDFSSPCLYSCITFSILLRTVRFDFGPEPDEVRFLELDFFLVGTPKTPPNYLETKTIRFVSRECAVRLLS
jgi:hypothetical protein